MSLRPSARRVMLAYLSGNSEQVEVVSRSLAVLLALLRAQAFSYQTSHWQVEGHDAYGNHLLFQRLYESVGTQIDELAEKMVGYHGPSSVNPAPAAQTMSQWVGLWAAIDCPFHRGLKSEEDFQVLIKSVYVAVKATGAMTLGLDDWLMATANAHETNTYLLQQTMLGSTHKVAAQRVAAQYLASDVAPSAESFFFDNPEKREVREFAQTKALSNDVAVVLEAPEAPPGEIGRAHDAPPTPTDTVQQPGGKELGTLNRFVVETEEPVVGVPKGHDEVPKHPDIKSAARVAQMWLGENSDTP